MKRWKSALIIVIVLFLSLIFFFVQPEDILKRIPLIKNLYQNTTLEVTTPYGRAKVLIDGKEYGETPSNIQNLVAGKYDIELQRVSNEDNFYIPHKFQVKLTKNTTTRINMEIGPDNILHGTVLYYTEDSNAVPNKGKITITDNAVNTKAYMNSEFLKSTPITNLELNEGEYQILLQSDGYEDLELPIVVRNGYILNIKGYLMPIPLIFDTAKDE
jgi:hypothetical protein